MRVSVEANAGLRHASSVRLCKGGRGAGRHLSTRIPTSPG